MVHDTGTPNLGFHYMSCCHLIVWYNDTVFVILATREPNLFISFDMNNDIIDIKHLSILKIVEVPQPIVPVVSRCVHVSPAMGAYYYSKCANSFGISCTCPIIVHILIVGTFATLILKVYVLQQLFPLKVGNYNASTMKITHVFPIICSKS